MQSQRRTMLIVGWSMTLLGSGTVLFWVLYEAAVSYRAAPLATLVSLVLVIGLLALLVPVPLIIANRRAHPGAQISHPPS